MNNDTLPEPTSSENNSIISTDREYREAEKRVNKIKRFYKNLASWAGVSIFMVALDLFLSGGISWSKYPVFFWGLSLVMEVFEIIRLQRMDKAWEERQMRRFTGGYTSKPSANPMAEPPTEQTKDYSGELLNQEERELADLSEYRKLNKPWKDEDLV